MCRASRLVAACVLSLCALTSNVGAEVFTYQGRLSNSGAPVSSNVDLRFRLFTSAAGAGQIGPQLEALNVALDDGLFTVDVDFGPGVFGATMRWLEIDVRFAGVGAFVTLAPRQPITATPVAQFALSGNPGPPGASPFELIGDDAVYTDGHVGVGTTAPEGSLTIGDPAVLSVFVPGDSNCYTPQGTPGCSDEGCESIVCEIDAFCCNNAWDSVCVGEANNACIGRVGIGTAAPIVRLHVTGGTDASLTAGGFIVTGAVAGTNIAIDNNEIMARNNGAAAPLAINADGGNVNFFQNSATARMGLGTSAPGFQLHLSTNSAAKPTSNVWTVSSDARLKRNIEPIEHALDDLLLLRGVTYQWKDPASQGNMAGTYTGMIAQDVEKVFPEWISEDANGYKHLTVIGFEGLVVEALREMRAEKDAEIAELRDENVALRARIQRLEGMMEQLVNSGGGTVR